MASSELNVQVRRAGRRAARRILVHVLALADGAVMINQPHTHTQMDILLTMRILLMRLPSLPWR